MIADATKTTATAAIAMTVLCRLIPLTMYSALDARVWVAPGTPPVDLIAGGTEVEMPAVGLGNRDDDVGLGLAREGRMTCSHFVEDNAQTPDVGARIDRFGARLFGRHVL